MNYQDIFSAICEDIKDTPPFGEVADYIPELAKVNPEHFGVHLQTITEKGFSFGNSEVPFSIQSIAKVFSLVMAYDIVGENLWERVGVEPSGTSFNSIVQLEHDSGIPRNPMLNAGAMVICDILMSHFENPKEAFLTFVRKVANNPNIAYNENIAASEKSKSYVNNALINVMKYYDNIKNEIDVVMDFYFHLCSIEMTAKELSKSFLFLANKGTLTHSGEEILNSSKTKRINAIMQLCGFYDQAGDFSFKIGLPGKSGVGGGIAAILPGEYSIVVWSPRLNKFGNSVRGIEFLEKFTTKTKHSIF
ncbi:MAG: glutaminase [Marivirga sp.]|jgi:glutaminase